MSCVTCFSPVLELVLIQYLSGGFGIVICNHTLQGIRSGGLPSPCHYVGQRMCGRSSQARMRLMDTCCGNHGWQHRFRMTSLQHMDHMNLNCHVIETRKVIWRRERRNKWSLQTLVLSVTLCFQCTALQRESYGNIQEFLHWLSEYPQHNTVRLHTWQEGTRR